MNKVVAVLLFAVFFGLLEAVVVVYLRQIFSLDPGSSGQISAGEVALSLGVITFLKPSASLVIMHGQKLLMVEILREAATIIMLITLAWAAGTNFKEKLAYFLLSFAVWDIFYYIFLYLLSGRPNSLKELDLLFLIPVAWIGPVITPVAISLIMIYLSILLLSHHRRNHKNYLKF